MTSATDNKEFELVERKAVSGKSGADITRVLEEQKLAESSRRACYLDELSAFFIKNANSSQSDKFKEFIGNCIEARRGRAADPYSRISPAESAVESSQYNKDLDKIAERVEGSLARKLERAGIMGDQGANALARTVVKRFVVYAEQKALKGKPINLEKIETWRSLMGFLELGDLGGFYKIISEQSKSGFKEILLFLQKEMQDAAPRYMQRLRGHLDRISETPQVPDQEAIGRLNRLSSFIDRVADSKATPVKSKLVKEIWEAMPGSPDERVLDDSTLRKLYALYNAILTSGEAFSMSLSQIHRYLDNFEKLRFYDPKTIRYEYYVTTQNQLKELCARFDPLIDAFKNRKTQGIVGVVKAFDDPKMAANNFLGDVVEVKSNLIIYYMRAIKNYYQSVPETTYGIETPKGVPGIGQLFGKANRLIETMLGDPSLVKSSRHSLWLLPLRDSYYSTLTFCASKGMNLADYEGSRDALRVLNRLNSAVAAFGAPEKSIPTEIEAESHVQRGGAAAASAATPLVDTSPVPAKK